MRKEFSIKIIKSVALFFFTVSLCAQIEANLPVVTYPHPSANALLQATINPVNYQTGVPDISLDLFSLKTLSKNIFVKTSLNYSTTGLSLKNKVGDSGMGWSLYGVPSISKIVNNDPDFRSRADLFSTTDDDVFVYNFHGNSGRFRVKKIALNTYVIEYLTPTNLTIQFYMNSNGSSTNEVNKFDEVDFFTIFDEFGNKFIFDIYDYKSAVFKASLKDPFKDYIPQGDGPPNFEINPTTAAKYRSTYYLSSVKNPNNQTIVNYTYEPFVRGVNLNSSFIISEIEHKLKEIVVPNNGKITFDYTYLPNYSSNYVDNPNSDFQLNSIKLFNNNILSRKFDFIYDYFHIYYNYYSNTTTYLSRKILKELKEYGENSNNYLSTKFEYNHPSLNGSSLNNCQEDVNSGRDIDGYLNLKHKAFPVIESSFPNDIIPEYATWYTEPSTVTTGALSKIIYPTGGSSLYEFESNTYSNSYYENIYSDNYYIDSDYIELNPFNNELEQNIISFNTVRRNSHTFTVQGEGTNKKNVYFYFNSLPYYSSIHHDPSEALLPTYRIIGPNGPLYEIISSGYIYDYKLGSMHYLHTYHPCIGNRFELEPGTYTLQILTHYDDASTSGTITISEKKPTNTIQKFFYGGGLRIKKIASFNHSNINSLVSLNTDEGLVDYVSFEYNYFDDPNRSSNDVYYYGINSSLSSAKTYDEYAHSLPFYSNVKVTKGRNASNGYEKFTYFRFNELQNIDPRSTNIFYQFKSGILKKHEVFGVNHEKVFEKEVDNLYMRDTKGFTWVYTGFQKSKNYFYPEDASTPTIVETVATYDYNPINKKISESTVSTSQGDTLTTKYFYHRGNSIHSQNRISEIERIETYRAGEPLSKSRIIYNNSWTNNVSFLPQTIETSKANEAYESRLRYLQYDEFGNPLEVKQEDGIHICYIWGYNKTQPIAKIENATYASIQGYAANLQTLSNGNDEQGLITALNDLRTALPNAMITTYTYKPLVGISTVTDPKGDKQTYHYDSFNRLQFVKDAQGNILSENQYHYRTQN